MNTKKSSCNAGEQAQQKPSQDDLFSKIKNTQAQSTLAAKRLKNSLIQQMKSECPQLS